MGTRGKPFTRGLSDRRNRLREGRREDVTGRAMRYRRSDYTRNNTGPREGGGGGGGQETGGGEEGEKRKREGVIRKSPIRFQSMLMSRIETRAVGSIHA